MSVTSSPLTRSSRGLETGAAAPAGTWRLRSGRKRRASAAALASTSSLPRARGRWRFGPAGPACSADAIRRLIEYLVTEPSLPTLRIWQIAESYPPDYGGGAGIAIHDVCHALSQRGHEVRVLCTEARDADPYTVR